MRASVRNISTKLSRAANCGRIRFTTTVFSKLPGPAAFARKTSAIPPVARRFTSS
jgi:hypothetical protein